MPAADLTAKQVAQILGRRIGPEAKEKKGRTALKLRAYMAAAFRLALGSEIDPMAPAASAGFGLTTNPAAAVPPTKMAAAFQRVGERTLSPAELRNYLVRLGALSSPMHRLAPIFAKELQKMVPSLKSAKKQFYGAYGLNVPTRKSFFLFPSKDECRKQFEAIGKFGPEIWEG